MDNVCKSCKYWTDFEQVTGVCSKITEKVGSDSRDEVELYTDYDFSCNLYVRVDKYYNIFVKCIKDMDIYKKGTIYLISMNKDYFDRNKELHEYFEFHNYNY